MTDHSWETTFVVDATLGFTAPPRPYMLYATDARSVAITGMLCSLSIEHGNGRKLHLGPLWLRRALQRADDVATQIENLEDP